MPNSCDRFDLQIKVAYQPGVWGILKREDIVKDVSTFLATLLWKRKRKMTNDKRPQWQVHLNGPSGSCGV